MCEKCEGVRRGIEMVEHGLGERETGFVPVAIDLIEGLIQFLEKRNGRAT